MNANRRMQPSFFQLSFEVKGYLPLYHKFQILIPFLHWTSTNIWSRFFFYKILQCYLPAGGKGHPYLLDFWQVSCSAESAHCHLQSHGPSRTFYLVVVPLANLHQHPHILYNCLLHLAVPCIVLHMQNLRKYKCYD